MADRLTLKRFVSDFVRGPGVPTNGRTVAAVEQKSIPVTPWTFWRDSTFQPLLGWADGEQENVAGRMAYVAAALAYICINFRAQKLCEPPIVVVEETDDGEEWIEDHELNPLLSHPNLDDTMRQFYFLTSVYRDLTGACLWLKIKDRGKRAVRLQAFSKEDVTVESVSPRLRGRFKIRTQTGEVIATPDDVIYFVNVDPRDPVNGAVAPLEVALSMLNFHGSLRVQARNMIKNAIRPPGVFSTADQLSDEQYARLDEQMRLHQGGGPHAGKWLLAEGGAEWKPISQELTSLVPAELIAWVEATVCPIFQLHPSMLGIKTGVENAPWSNLKQATQLLYEMMALPRWASDEEVLTDQLLRDFDDDESHLIRFDTARIPALQEDVEEKLEKFRHVFPYLTVNEVRQMADFDPLPGPEGEVRYVPIGWTEASMLTAVEDEPFGGQEEEPDEGDENPAGVDV